MPTSGEMKVFLSEEKVQEIKEHWAPLQNSPENNWDLYWSSLRNRSESTGPYVLSVHNENRLSGMLMGWVEKGQVVLRVGYWRLLRVPVRKIMITSIQTFLPEDNKELLRRMVSRVVGDLRGRLADVAVFDFVPEDSKVYQVLKEMELSLRMRDNFPERRIHWYLSLPASFNEYQRKHKGFMQKVRKFERAYEGRFHYRRYRGVDEIDEFCSAAEMVSRKTYQRALGVGFLNSEEDRGKIRAVAAQGAWLAFVEFVDEKAVAFWSGCRFGSNVFLWWTAYDTDYQEFSPGLVSFARMAERLMAEGVTGIDFGGGDAAYKERLCNKSQWEETVCIYAPTLRGMLAKGVRGLDATLGNLTRTRLKSLANRVKTPWRRLMAQRMLRREERSETILKVGDWVEVLPLREVLATIDGCGRFENVPFMPEMVPYCGGRFKITAIMTKICGGGKGIRAVAGAPLLLLDDLRCEGSSHGGCSRLCTLLWKASWLKPVDVPSVGTARRRDETEATAWPYPTRTGGGAYQCQATALPQATVPMSVAEKLRRALADVAVGDLGLGAFMKACARGGCYRIRPFYERFVGRVQQVQYTPSERLDLQPGEWVETKSVSEIAGTLDRNHKNRGLEFSVYMVSYCGGKYRVKSRMGKFIDERTGKMRDLKHTVILEGVTCTGETTSGKCRRAECLYWREIWLKRVENPEEWQ